MLTLIGEKAGKTKIQAQIIKVVYSSQQPKSILTAVQLKLFPVLTVVELETYYLFDSTNCNWTSKSREIATNTVVQFKNI